MSKVEKFSGSTREDFFIWVEKFIQEQARPVLCVVGATGSGKSKLGVELAKKFNGEVISLDSRQVYKGMSIGTGKVTNEEMSGVKHHLIDVLEPSETCSVDMMKEETERLIKEITEEGKLPILVGGTGLYVEAIILGYTLTKVKPNWDRRAELEEEMNDIGQEAMWEKLKEMDPEAADKVHPNNRYRLIRLIEKCESGEKAVAERGEIAGDYLLMGVEWPREILYRRCESRVDAMVEEGFLTEVKELMDKGYEKCSSMTSIGYEEMMAVVKEEMSLRDAEISMKKRTRHYIKRQLTWWKRHENISWVPGDCFY